MGGLIGHYLAANHPKATIAMHIIMTWICQHRRVWRLFAHVLKEYARAQADCGATSARISCKVGLVCS